MSLPARLRTHTITVEPYEGAGPYGDVFGDPVEITCRVEAELKLVRSASGQEVTSTSTIYCDPDVTIPPESRVTIGERVTTVITELDPSTGGRSRLDHKEVALV